MADPKALSLLQEEQFAAFNALVEAQGGNVDLSEAHLRGYDLRKCRLSQANLRDAYLRSADLRNVDLSHADMDGASLKEAHVSGTRFPVTLHAAEIQLSLTHGTRLRQDMTA